MLAYVHLYTLFMVVPIFNSMMRIDRSLIEAARDAGATRLADRCGTSSCRCASPASRIGSIFVVTLVMGDFVDRQRDERRPERLGRADDDEPDVAAAVSGGGGQRRGAAASLVLLMVAAILRMVDIRKEL